VYFLNHYEKLNIWFPRSFNLATNDLKLTGREEEGEKKS